MNYSLSLMISNIDEEEISRFRIVRDEVAEWLRRWTANPMGSARVGSNPILVGNFLKIFLTTM